MPVDLLAAQAPKKPKDLLGPEPSLIDDIMQGPVGQIGSGALEGVASLPGIPVEIASWMKGVPIEKSNLEGWGAKGWQDFVRRNIGEISAPAPTDEIGMASRKLGGFLGGGAALGGIAGMVPSLTGFAGSEIGRATDAEGITGGYGEVAGGLVGGLAPGLVRGQFTSGVKSAPTNEAHRAAAKAAYKAAEDAGVIVNQDGVNRLAVNIRDTLRRETFRPKLQPRIGPILDEIQGSLEAGRVTLNDLDSLRKVANAARTGSTDATERMMAGQIIDHVDDLIDTLKPHEIVAGNAKAGAAALKEARGHWSVLKKSELIDDALGDAGLRAAGAGKGANIDNNTRQNLRKLLTNKKTKNVWTKQEKAQIMRTIVSSNPHHVLRLIGGLSPDIGVLGMMGSTGLAGLVGTGAVTPWALAAPLVGYVAKHGSDALTARNVARLSSTIRSGPKAALTQRQRANEAMLELQRRAKLAGQSTAKAVPGTFSTRQE